MLSQSAIDVFKNYADISKQWNGFPYVADFEYDLKEIYFKELEEQGYIEVERDETGEMATYLAFTVKGKELAKSFGISLE